MKSLFGDDMADTPPSWKKWKKPRYDRAHPAAPGSGPAAKTCADCQHYRRVQAAKVYRKCGLMEKYWTCSAATDIRAGDHACSHFREQTEPQS